MEPRNARGYLPSRRGATRRYCRTGGNYHARRPQFNLEIRGSLSVRPQLRQLVTTVGSRYNGRKNLVGRTEEICQVGSADNALAKEPLSRVA